MEIRTDRPTGRQWLELLMEGLSVCLRDTVDIVTNQSRQMTRCVRSCCMYPFQSRLEKIQLDVDSSSRLTPEFNSTQPNSTRIVVRAELRGF